MAVRFVNYFRRGRSTNYLANQTLVTCQRTFAHSIEETNIAHQKVRTIYDAVIAGVRTNQIKLRLTEELVDKLCDEASSLGSIAGKLKEHIEKDEKHVEERKKVVSEISANIRQFRLSLDPLKDQWIAGNKDVPLRVQTIAMERVAVEQERHMLMCKSNVLSEAYDEIEAETERLQVIRRNYMEAHNEDIDDLKAKLNMVLEIRKLYKLETMTNPKEIVSIFSSNDTKFENTLEEFFELREMRRLRELEIQSLCEEIDALNEVNKELMFRVIHEKEELVKLKGEKGMFRVIHEKEELVKLKGEKGNRKPSGNRVFERFAVSLSSLQKYFTRLFR